MEIDVFDFDHDFSDMQLKKARVAVNQIFQVLAAICPAYKQAWPTDKELAAAKKEWAIALASDKNLNVKMVNHGLYKLRKKDLPFVPSPGEFLELCKPTPGDLGLPDARKAYEEACRNAHPISQPDWSHQVVYAAALSTGFYELSRLPSSQTYPIFEKNYEKALCDYVNGQKVTIPKAIVEDVQKKANPDIARKYISDIKEILKG